MLKNAKKTVVEIMISMMPVTIIVMLLLGLYCIGVGVCGISNIGTNAVADEPATVELVTILKSEDIKSRTVYLETRIDHIRWNGKDFLIARERDGGIQLIQVTY